MPNHTDITKITAGLPTHLLHDAMKAYDAGVTETLRTLLENDHRQRAARELSKWRGTVDFGEYDWKGMREEKSPHWPDDPV